MSTESAQRLMKANLILVNFLKMETILSIIDITIRTSFLAQISLGPWTFVLDMGSSIQLGLIITPGQETI